MAPKLNCHSNLIHIQNNIAAKDKLIASNPAFNNSMKTLNNINVKNRETTTDSSESSSDSSDDETYKKQEIFKRLKEMGHGTIWLLYEITSRCVV